MGSSPTGRTKRGESPRQVKRAMDIQDRGSAEPSGENGLDLPCQDFGEVAELIRHLTVNQDPHRGLEVG